jgi:phosphoribosylformylglycinamidine synthase
MIHIFRIPGSQSEQAVLQKINQTIPSIISVKTESCFNIEVKKGQELREEELKNLNWLFRETYEPTSTRDSSYLTASDNSVIVEVGPRLAFSTAWSSNCVSMCQACGINSVGM